MLRLQKWFLFFHLEKTVENFFYCVFEKTDFFSKKKKNCFWVKCCSRRVMLWKHIDNMWTHSLIFVNSCVHVVFEFKMWPQLTNGIESNLELRLVRTLFLEHHFAFLQIISKSKTAKTLSKGLSMCELDHSICGVNIFTRRTIYVADKLTDHLRHSSIEVLAF